MITFLVELYQQKHLNIYISNFRVNCIVEINNEVFYLWVGLFYYKFEKQSHCQLYKFCFEKFDNLLSKTSVYHV